MFANPQRSKDLLTRIATHLRGDDRGHPVFDFSHVSSYNEFAECLPSVPHCGTAGCAIGEFPIIFPDKFIFARSVDPSLRNIRMKDTPHEDISVSGEVSSFLGIPRDAVDHLFYPYTQSVRAFGGDLLPYDASRFEVANNIDDFIKKVLDPLLPA